MLAGGGTGGHVYPLLAVVESLVTAQSSHSAARARPGELCSPTGPDQASAASLETYSFHWLGSERSEARIVPEFQPPIAFHQIDIRFSYRLPTPRNWSYYRRHIVPLLGGRPFRQALAVLDEVRPALVFASGGYVSAPALWAARARGIPYALLQLDAAIGMVNAFFAPGAARIYASTQTAARRFKVLAPDERVLLSGFPARRARLTREQFFTQFGLDPRRKLLVVMGGSLGTGAIAGLTAALVRELDVSAYADSLSILFAAGERMDTADAIRDSRPQRVQFAAVDYLGDSVSALAAADFYLGRSGASTVAELVASGPQCLLIPDPQHADRQQYANAAQLAVRGQGALLEQREATGKAAVAWLAEVWERGRVRPPEPPAADVIAADLRQLLH
jgi:UDP-N-acetylglucosamine--N-acetylmuramyl-(pentapeptide) pyrophosphoryl-undecaprenol N-acetylglucosamine transferase